MRDDATRSGCLQLPLSYQYHDQVRCESGQRCSARHLDIAILEKYAIDHVDYSVGALDVWTYDMDSLTLPLQNVA